MCVCENKNENYSLTEWVKVKLMSVPTCSVCTTYKEIVRIPGQKGPSSAPWSPALIPRFLTTGSPFLLFPAAVHMFAVRRGDNWRCMSRADCLYCDILNWIGRVPWSLYNPVCWLGAEAGAACPARGPAQIREQLQNSGPGGWKPHVWEVPEAVKPFLLVSNPPLSHIRDDRGLAWQEPFRERLCLARVGNAWGDP